MWNLFISVTMWPSSWSHTPPHRYLPTSQKKPKYIGWHLSSWNRRTDPNHKGNLVNDERKNRKEAKVPVRDQTYVGDPLLCDYSSLARAAAVSRCQNVCVSWGSVLPSLNQQKIACSYFRITLFPTSEIWK